MYQLYYYPNNASLAPHFLLKHMGLDYELILVDKKNNRQKSQDYLALNPAGRIPTLIHDGNALFESPAICIHLCEQHPEFALLPPIGDKHRPLFFQWLTYLNNTLQAELMVYYYPSRHTDHEHHVDGIQTAQNRRVSEALSVIDGQLSRHSYLVGDTLTACDFFLFMLALWSMPIERGPMSFPNLSAYLRRLSTHPTIVAVCELENIELTEFQ